EIKVNKRMVFDPALRRFRAIFTRVTIISLICCFVPVAGYSQTDRVDELIQKLKDGDSGVRWIAAEALGEIKDIRAIKPLILALKDEYLGVQMSAAGALVMIGTPAVEPLITTLKDKNSDVRMFAAEALGEIKDTRAVKPLLAALKAKDLAVVTGAHSFFIRRGEQKSIPILIDALNEYGNKEMAADFSNCGNSQLKKAGRAWTKEHDCTIESDGGGGPQWGSKNR
ncbi:HEAT repeat domain-containing protein, partial [bacterium]|nr:HEAT repeat domain-containing protein [bacterium]